MHINNRDKWIYEVTFSRNFGGTISKISWDRLVQEVSKRKPSQIKEVTFYYPDMPGGTMQIPGNLMLILWQQADLAKSPKSSN